MWTLDSSQLVLIKGDLSGAPHDFPKGLFSGGCIDFSIYPAVRSKLCSLSLHTSLYTSVSQPIKQVKGTQRVEN